MFLGSLAPSVPQLHDSDKVWLSPGAAVVPLHRAWHICGSRTIPGNGQSCDLIGLTAKAAGKSHRVASRVSTTGRWELVQMAKHMAGVTWWLQVINSGECWGQLGGDGGTTLAPADTLLSYTYVLSASCSTFPFFPRTWDSTRHLAVSGVTYLPLPKRECPFLK